MTTVYSIIGEHSDDPARLLALGADGQHYALVLSQGTLTPVDVDDSWSLDPEAPDREDILLDPPASGSARW